MKEEFKKWLCEKAGYNYNAWGKPCPYDIHDIKILIKAMWAINRETRDDYIRYGPTGFSRCYYDVEDMGMTRFDIKDHNNSEQQALEAALKYIWEAGDGN
jgi:hypothetical protein